MKHAFLIIAHNNPEILLAQLSILKSDHCDFYYHIDPKFRLDQSAIKTKSGSSYVEFVEAKKVRWGHYSQIECELRLLKAAVSHGGYDYYHLLSGVDMPIKTIETIDVFFEKNKGKEFVHFDAAQVQEVDVERIKYYHVLPGRKQFERRINGLFIRLQKLMGVDRLRKSGWTVQKGANWFSITHQFAEELVRNEFLLKKRFSYSFCGDEIFLQTYLVNSKYKSNLYGKTLNNDYSMCMRAIDWKRGNPYIYRIEDISDLLKSNLLFARKFDYQIDQAAVDKLEKILGSK